MSLETKNFAFDDFLLDTKEKVLFRNGKPLPVTQKAFHLLLVLVQNHGHLVEKNELMNRVWPDSFVEEGNLAFTIGLLRKALGDDSQRPHLIETVPRRGYRFVAEVEEKSNKIAQPSAPTTRTPWYYLAFGGLCILLLCTLAAGPWLARAKLFSSASNPTILTAPFHSEKFSSSGTVTYTAISPDGKLAAYVDETDGRLSVWLRKLETSENMLIVPPGDELYFGLVFAHDGQSLYFVRRLRGAEQNPGKIYRVSILGGVPQQIVSFAEGWISLSPDDTQISFVRCQYKDDDFCSLMIADTSGKNERKVLTHVRPLRISDNQFSPDGRSIAFAIGASGNGGKDFHLAKVDLESGMEMPIPSRKFFNIDSLKWMPEGESLVVAAREMLDGQSKLWQVSINTGDTLLLTKDSSSYTDISLNKDASRMIATKLENNFRLYLSTNGQTKNLATAREAVFTSDGKIIYSSDGDIWTINREGGEQRQLTTDPYKDFSPCMSPDRRYIYFTSNRTGANQVWRMNIDGSNQTEITKTEGGYPVFVSADGLWVFYESGLHRTLWKVSIESGEETQVSEQRVFRPAFSADGSLVAFFCPSRTNITKIAVAVMRLADNKIIKETDFNDLQLEPVRVAWSSDRRSVTYVTKDEHNNSLWFQSLDDKSPRLIADLGNREVEDFALAPDDNSFAYVRGEWLHDAVLIDGLK